MCVSLSRDWTHEGESASLCVCLCVCEQVSKPPFLGQQVASNTVTETNKYTLVTQSHALKSQLILLNIPLFADGGIPAGAAITCFFPETTPFYVQALCVCVCVWVFAQSASRKGPSVGSHSLQFQEFSWTFDVELAPEWSL